MVNVFRLRNASLLLMSYSSRDSGAFSTVWHHLPWKFSWLNGSWMEAARYDWRGRDYRLLCELSWGGWWGTRKMEGSQHQGHQRCSIQGKQAYFSVVWHILGMVTCLRVHTQDLLKDLCHFSGVHWQHWHGEIRSVWLAKQDIYTFWFTYVSIIIVALTPRKKNMCQGVGVEWDFTALPITDASDSLCWINCSAFLEHHLLGPVAKSQHS